MVVLNDILTAKEERRINQDALRTRYNNNLVSISINTPGAEKNLPAARCLCDFSVAQIRNKLYVIAEERYNKHTGPEALLVVDGDAGVIKQTAIEIEESYSFGRLMDIDVFNSAGDLISRQQEGTFRKCFICGQAAVVCMREQRHNPAELVRAADRMFSEFLAFETRFISPLAEKLGALAVEAMLYEVASTPAPGLVDRVNSGAHTDMDIYTFQASTAALNTTMARCAQAGLNHKDELPALLPILRLIGLEGERAMLAATCGINTQKGLLFLLGIIAAAAGIAINRRIELCAAKVIQIATDIAKDAVTRELAAVHKKEDAHLTAGERLYRKYGVAGIRGELAAGLPAVINNGLPALAQALKDGLTINDALVQALLVLMTCVDDTTVMNRHNPDKMRVWVRSQAIAALTAGGMKTEEGRHMIAKLDELFIAHNVSPGGTADLLAVTWFLYRCQTVEW